jgi:2-polyprenyl-6-methoxyphenol hydroxylase-like FAD-dependent oxidoreductase
MQITTYLGDRPIMKLHFGDPHLRTAAPPMVVSQAKVEAALRDRFAELGGAPEWGQPLVDVKQHADGVSAVLGDGRQVRKLVGIDFAGVMLTERFLLADLRLDWDLDRSGTTGWIHPAGMLGAMPMLDPDGRSDLWRLIIYDPTYSEKPSEQGILERIHTLLPERTHREVRIGDAQWLSLFSVHRRLVDSYRRARIVLAGDAAHAHAPFGGQGMLTGIGDAENLAWKLALVIRCRAHEPLIDTYQAERRPLATEVLRGTSAVTRVNVASNPVGRFVRDRIILPLFSLPWIQRRATYAASQLWVSYRKGPLGGRGGRQRSGDRIGDLDCVRDDGKPSRLHAELGGRWALLLPQASTPAVADVARGWLGELVGVLGYAGERAMLVRPDAHLAWRGDSQDTAGLDRWLAMALQDGRAHR